LVCPIVQPFFKLKKSKSHFLIYKKFLDGCNFQLLFRNKAYKVVMVIYFVGEVENDNLKQGIIVLGYNFS